MIALFMQQIKGLVLFILLCGGITMGCPAKAEPVVFSKVIKVSLIFEVPPDGSPYLRIYLRMVNGYDSDVTWGCNSVMGIESELLDSAGKPVPQGPTAASITSNNVCYLIPYGSRLDWLISHGGMSGADESGKSYILEVGGKLWSVPKNSVGSYSLRIRLTGVPWMNSEEQYNSAREKRLLDLPPQKIVISQ
jgi:hypothetical protein